MQHFSNHEPNVPFIRMSLIKDMMITFSNSPAKLSSGRFESAYANLIGMPFFKRDTSLTTLLHLSESDTGQMVSELVDCVAIETQMHVISSGFEQSDEDAIHLIRLDCEAEEKSLNLLTGHAAHFENPTVIDLRNAHNITSALYSLITTALDEKTVNGNPVPNWLFVNTLTQAQRAEENTRSAKLRSFGLSVNQTH